MYCFAGKFLPVDKEPEVYVDEENSPPYVSQHTVVPAAWSYVANAQSRAHSMAFLTPPPYQSGPQITMVPSTPNPNASLAPCDRNMNNTLSNNNNNKSNGTVCADDYGFDVHSVVCMDILERTKGKQLNGLIETRNEEVLRRVAEMQRMVENSEKYLNEQGELVHEFEMKPNTRLPWKDTSVDCDSDSGSMASSKVSSNEEAPAPGCLKHSDSLVLLAESINLDLSGITKALNLIGNNLSSNNGSQNNTPSAQRRTQGLSQLLSDLQALSTDLSESDSESVSTPNQSPMHRNHQQPERSLAQKHFRTSFGLHSPDNLGPDAKDTNLRDYLRHLKEASNKEDIQDIDLAAKKLSELYGFEIGDEPFIDSDPDVIDLTAIPPPQTPDELDALSVLSAAPLSFADDDKHGDLESFLARVRVAPPMQKVTPAKELTPEEIMSFIIPPPPGLGDEPLDKEIRNGKEESSVPTSGPEEDLYINSANQTNGVRPKHAIEYATVERRGSFSCCTKLKKNDTPPNAGLPLPPRRCQHTNPAPRPPERPPKSALQSPTRPSQPMPISTFRLNGGGTGHFYSVEPPKLPPRNDNNNQSPPLVALPPRKPSLPMKPVFRTIPASLVNTGDHSYTSPIRLATVPSPPCSRHVYPNPAIDRNFSSGSPMQPIPAIRSNGHFRSYSDCPPVPNQHEPKLSLLCSPQMSRRISNSPQPGRSPSPISPLFDFTSSPGSPRLVSPRIGQSPLVVNVASLMSKTDVAMSGLLVRLDQIAAQCSAAQTAGGGVLIDEARFQKARHDLTEQALQLVTASKLLVMAMSEPVGDTLPAHLTASLTALRRITELAQDMTKHTTSPLQTRNIVLKIHDVASMFRELAGVETGSAGAGPLALQAECLANVLATLLRSLRVFSP